MADRNETTSDRIQRIASRGLRTPSSLTPSDIRAVCASALSQSPPRKSLLARLMGSGK